MEIEDEVENEGDKTTGNEKGENDGEEKTLEEEEEEEIKPVRRKTKSQPQQKKNKEGKSDRADVVEGKVVDEGKNNQVKIILKVKEENYKKAEVKRRKARMTYGTKNASSTVDLDKSEKDPRKRRTTPRKK